MKNKAFFFCGIGGSGMLPLAAILKDMGAGVSGSDRARDQGRLTEKFSQLETAGFGLFPQDGSGLKAGQTLVASAAIEDSVPDIAAANALGLLRQTRAECLASLFNDAAQPIGIAGTSGKSTTTGMVGHILTECGTDPTVMNGADMINFRRADTPVASARVGNGGGFISEIDESDGSIALYNCAIAVLNNVAEDHKPIAELRILFSDFLKRAAHRVVNADHPEVMALAAGLTHTLRYSLTPDCANADLVISNIEALPLHSGSTFTVTHVPTGNSFAARIQLPGRHNVANAAAALCVALLSDIPLTDAISALSEFKGIARRFEVIGRHEDITVIDDFGHNPDKIAATFRTLHSEAGRLLIFFQPHGFGPLRLMKAGFIHGFAAGLNNADHLIMPEPVYYGGTTNRSVSTMDVINGVNAKRSPSETTDQAAPSEGYATRAECGDRLIELVERGDRVVIMGARDDTLTEFANDIFSRVQAKFP